jgi:hypothetical protein
MSSHKFGRNELCPCGSGKKYKFCCLENFNPTSSESFLNTPPTNAQREVSYLFSSEMLMKRVNREAHKIAEHFDVLTRDQVVYIDELYSAVGTILVTAKKGAEKDKDEVRIALAVLLSNVLKSYTAAFALLRSGWRLQPFLCIRNSYEGLGLMLHLYTNWEELPQYKAGKLKSTVNFDSAKKLLPHFGKLYGDLSKNFVHVGRPFGYVQKGNLYSENEMDLWHCLGQLALLIWVIYQTAELVFYDYIDKRLFWKETGEQYRSRRVQAGIAYRLNPTDEARQLKNRFFSFYQTKLSDFNAEVGLDSI